MEDRSYFYLTPKHQEKFIEVMRELEVRGVKPTKEVQTVVLHEMARHGYILKMDAKQAAETIGKLHGPDAKILVMGECQHPDPWFSRSIDVCEHDVEGMHYYCNTCHSCVDGHGDEK